VPDGAYFLRDDREPCPLRAGARTLDQRIEGQHLHLVGNLLDRPGLFARDLIDLAGQPRDQRRDVGVGLHALGIIRFVSGRSHRFPLKRNGQRNVLNMMETVASKNGIATSDLALRDLRLISV
jgi:hypothetical protein